MLLFALILLLIVVALSSSVTSTVLIRTTSLCLFVSTALATNAIDTAVGTGVTLYSGLLSVTLNGAYIDTLLLFAGAIAITPWPNLNLNTTTAVINVSDTASSSSSSTVTETTPTLNQPLFILFTVLGSTCLVASNDLISVYLSIELQSFAVYILAAINRDSESSTHAGLLYFLLGGLSSSLILLGSALVYSSTGHTNLESIIALVSIGEYMQGPWIIGVIILTIGFLFKVTAAPFHNWGPDVYDGVPTIMTTWLAVLPKIAIMGLLLELTSGLGGSMNLFYDGIPYNVWSGLLLTCSLLSLLIGTIVGLAQVRIKRLLAYSTISHVGFLLMALAVSSEEATEAYLFFLGQYTFTALNAFLVVLAMGYIIHHNKDITLIQQLQGVFSTNPLLGLSLAASLFSMAGVPPLVGFFGKQSVLYTVIHGGNYFLALVAIVTSVISGAYYLRVIRVVHFYPATTDSAPTYAEVGGRVVVPVSSVHSYLIALLTLGICFFIATSGLILDSTSLVACSMFIQ